MSIACSGAEICSIIFDIKYWQIYADPGLKYAEHTYMTIVTHVHTYNHHSNAIHTCMHKAIYTVFSLSASICLCLCLSLTHTHTHTCTMLYTLFVLYNNRYTHTHPVVLNGVVESMFETLYCQLALSHNSPVQSSQVGKNAGCCNSK